MTFPPEVPHVRPQALQPGDTVGVIAPASSFQRDAFEAGCATLLRLGYKPFFLDNIFERVLYFAGTAERRLNELHEMFRRPEVKAILCARGGYGCNYLLPRIDLDLVRSNPKLFGGCSDVTALLTYFTDAAGLVTFHAPMVAGDLARAEGLDEAAWMTAVSGGSFDRTFAADEVEPLIAGAGEGVLYGGCLSILCASLGTRYEIRTAGTVLFLEDRGERPYRIDRMLMQLKLAGKFDGVRGIVFGEMTGCAARDDEDYTLPQIIKLIVGDLGVPVAFGLKSGHVSERSITLPFGVAARLDVGEQVRLRYQAAVTAGGR